MAVVQDGKNTGLNFTTEQMYAMQAAVWMNKDIDAAVNTYYSSKIARAQYQAAAAQARGQAQLSRINASTASYALLANQARMENDAMMQGLQAAQQMAATRVSQAGSGVYMNSASSYEVRASQRFAQAVNMGNMEINRANQLASDKAQITNYLSEAIGYEGQAKANQIMADAINPKRNAIGSFLGSALGHVGTIVGSNLFGNLQLNTMDVYKDTSGAVMQPHTSGGNH